jgi:hypothetical protein
MRGAIGIRYEKVTLHISPTLFTLGKRSANTHTELAWKRQMYTAVSTVSSCAHRGFVCGRVASLRELHDLTQSESCLCAIGLVHLVQFSLHPAIDRESLEAG